MEVVLEEPALSQEGVVETCRKKLVAEDWSLTVAEARAIEPDPTVFDRPPCVLYGTPRVIPNVV